MLIIYYSENKATLQNICIILWSPYIIISAIAGLVFVYMLASQRNGTLYAGVTSDLIKRVWQHKEGVADGFTKKYSTKKDDEFSEITASGITDYPVAINAKDLK